jgi:hypothetical protein
MLSSEGAKDRCASAEMRLEGLGRDAVDGGVVLLGGLPDVGVDRGKLGVVCGMMAGRN